MLNESLKERYCLEDAEIGGVLREGCEDVEWLRRSFMWQVFVMTGYFLIIGVPF